MKIMIPVDDMPYTLASLYSVQQRSWPPGTKFVLCRVIENCADYTQPANLNEAERSIALASDTEYHKEKSAKWLQVLAKSLKLEGCEVDTELLMGEVPEQLSLLANRFEIDYIIIGSHDRTPSERAWLGSVASSVSEHVDCSLEIVRPKVLHQLLIEDKLDDKSIESIDYSPLKVLLAIDFSENSLGALKWLGTIGLPLDAGASVIIVDPPKDKGLIEFKLSRGTAGDDIASVREKDVAFKLREYTTIIEDNVRIVETQVLRGEPAKQILEKANSIGADLIVVGAHGVSNNPNSTVGSVTREVIDGASCSVISINASSWERVNFRWKSTT